MTRDLNTSRNPSADPDHHVELFPTRSAAYVLADSPGRPAGGPTGPPKWVTSRVVREVVVLEIAGRLSDAVGEDAVGELDLAVRLALAEGPPGVVCHLPPAIESAEALAEVLAIAGRHAQDWPGIPVAVACPDPQARAMRAAHPPGAHLIVTTSINSAVSTVLAASAPAVAWLHLAPHPTAPRASRDFVTRTLTEWGLAPLVRPAGLVVRELVANSMHAGTDIDVSVSWDREAIRLTVRDQSPDLPSLPFSHDDPLARRLSVVAVLSRSFGVLPTAEGGRVVWAVLSDARPVPRDHTLEEPTPTARRSLTDRQPSDSPGSFRRLVRAS